MLSRTTLADGKDNALLVWPGRHLKYAERGAEGHASLVPDSSTSSTWSSQKQNAEVYHLSSPFLFILIRVDDKISAPLCKSQVLEERKQSRAIENW